MLSLVTIGNFFSRDLNSSTSIFLPTIGTLYAAEDDLPLAGPPA